MVCFRHQPITTTENQNREIFKVEDYPQVGLVYKHLIDEAVESRKRQKISATWYITESLNPVLSPHLETEVYFFIKVLGITNLFMNVANNYILHIIYFATKYIYLNI
jgi:hypothetical protein